MAKHEAGKRLSVNPPSTLLSSDAAPWRLELPRSQRPSPPQPLFVVFSTTKHPGRGTSPTRKTIHVDLLRDELFFNADMNMDTADELQKLEITALRAIYGEDFIEVAPPKVWKVRV